MNQIGSVCGLVGLRHKLTDWAWPICGRLWGPKTPGLLWELGWSSSLCLSQIGRGRPSLLRGWSSPRRSDLLRGMMLLGWLTYRGLMWVRGSLHPRPRRSRAHHHHDHISCAAVGVVVVLMWRLLSSVVLEP